jgi:Mg2+ and Co2+ transporter CorA
MTAIRVTLLQGDRLRQGNESLIDEWRRDSDEKLWVDIQDPVQEVIEPLLEERFGFHELAAEDTLSATTLPRPTRSRHSSARTFSLPSTAPPCARSTTSATGWRAIVG